MITLEVVSDQPTRPPAHTYIDLYVYIFPCSGSENSKGYIWDRHYEAQVATLAHEKVVNCVAVNPRDPHMAVSVSDDHTIKIWRSKSFHR